MKSEKEPVVVLAQAVVPVDDAPQASAPPAHEAPALPAGWTPDCYMPDWTEEKRHRFEELAQEMEWDLASIKAAAHALAVLSLSPSLPPSLSLSLPLSLSPPLSVAPMLSVSVSDARALSHAL